MAVTNTQNPAPTRLTHKCINETKLNIIYSYSKPIYTPNTTLSYHHYPSAIDTFPT